MAPLGAVGHELERAYVGSPRFVGPLESPQELCARSVQVAVVVELEGVEEREPGGGRLQPLNPDNNNDMNLRVGLHSASDVDSDVRHWLSRAYRANV